MGPSLLLSLLLLPASLQAGECPGHPGSAPRARSPQEGLWLGSWRRGLLG